jgi:hypothetical protein
MPSKRSVAHYIWTVHRVHPWPMAPLNKSSHLVNFLQIKSIYTSPLSGACGMRVRMILGAGADRGG